MNSEKARSPSYVDVVWYIITLALLAMISIGLYQAFMSPDRTNPLIFGTASAPYSDALGPWLEGGLTFLFGYPPPSYLYRPTVGVFWGSILAGTNRIESIPLFFSLWLIALIGAMAVRIQVPQISHPFIITLGIIGLGFQNTWHHLNIATTAVDFPALVLTLTGVQLTLSGCHLKQYPALLVGSVCLGVVAAIRGPMMVAGPIVLGIAIFCNGRIPVRIMVSALIFFVMPAVIDIALQRHFGVANNGLVALYCAYSDPSHAWSGICHNSFLAKLPSGREIISNFLTDAISVNGLSRLIQRINTRLIEDINSMFGLTSLALLIACGILESRSVRFVRNAWGMFITVTTAPAFRALIIAISLVLATRIGTSWYWIFLTWLFVMTVASIVLRNWYALTCFISYLAATIYLCALGLGANRLQNTFSFLLPLGLSFLIIYIPGRISGTETNDPSTHGRAFPALIAGFICFLYLGAFLIPNNWRDTYLKDIKGQSGIALKIGDDKRLNRSLYYSGDRQIFYTKHDSLEIGSTRHYQQLLTNATGNVSFLQPNQFVD